eukprot:scaffold3417_cov30-Phaeocystis_antarctica.AAC.2
MVKGREIGATLTQAAGSTGWCQRHSSGVRSAARSLASPGTLVAVALPRRHFEPAAAPGPRSSARGSARGSELQLGAPATW